MTACTDSLISCRQKLLVFLFVLCAWSILQLSATRHLNTDSDTELLSELFGMELAARRPAIGPPVTLELLFEVVQVNDRHVPYRTPGVGKAAGAFFVRSASHLRCPGQVFLGRVELAYRS